MLKVLVTFAIENEFAPWREAHKFRAGAWSSPEVSSVEMHAIDAGVLLTGIGPKVAGNAVARVLRAEAGTVQCCISSGLAGGLRSQYQVGQVLVARMVSSEDARSGDPRGLLNSSEALVSFAAECGAVVVERFFSSIRVVGTVQEKQHLGERADAVEMESFGVLSAANADGVPAVAIRAISDTVDEELPLDMNAVITGEGQLSVPRVLGQVARHPGALPGLVRLGKHSRQAAGALSEFLDRYIAKLGSAQIFEKGIAAF
jgi:adenosylhomocysteine nucleosidase